MDLNKPSKRICKDRRHHLSFSPSDRQNPPTEPSGLLIGTSRNDHSTPRSETTSWRLDCLDDVLIVTPPEDDHSAATAATFRTATTRWRFACLHRNDPTTGFYESPLDSLLQDSNISILASCNGLVCFSRFNQRLKQNIYYICNPATDEFQTLPEHPPIKSRSSSPLSVGIAFDPSVSFHYKLVFVVDRETLGHEHQARQLFSFSVFSSKKGTWQVSNYNFTRNDIFGRQPPVFSKGTLYWAFSHEHILAFHVDNRFLRLIQLPATAFCNCLPSCLGELNGFLFCVMKSDDGFCVWKLEEKGAIQAKWSLEGRVSRESFWPDYYLPLLFANFVFAIALRDNGNGGEVVFLQDNRIVTYNLGMRRMEDVGFTVFTYDLLKERIPVPYMNTIHTFPYAMSLGSCKINLS